MSELAKSFEVLQAKIRQSGCCVVETPNGYFHCYKKEVVQARLQEIQEEINRLYLKLGE